jgi:hypothetical protein
MKQLFILIFLSFLSSCLDSPKAPNSKAVGTNVLSSVLKSPFYDDNFKIVPIENWILTNQSDTFNSYNHQDLNKMIFYRINVYNLSKDLESIGLERFNEEYEENYFNEYKNSLIKDKCDYHIGSIAGHEAIYSEYLVTNEQLINNKEILEKVKMVTFLNINKSYTLSVICKPEITDSVFKSFIECFKFLDDNTNHTFTSKKYNYRIVIPIGYSISESTNPHIDLKLTKPDGTSILINVTKRLPAEYSITAHDYTKEFFETSFKTQTPEIELISAEKSYIDEIQAFLISYVNSQNSLKSIEIYFYKDDLAYVLTATTPLKNFYNSERIFLETFYSLKFN